MLTDYERETLSFISKYMQGDRNIESAYLDTESAQVLFFSLNPNPNSLRYEKTLNRGVRIDYLKDMMLKIEKISLALEELKKEVPEILI